MPYSHPRNWRNGSPRSWNQADQAVWDEFYKAVGEEFSRLSVDELAAFFIDLNDPSTIEAVLWSDGEHEFLDSGCEYRY